jgi:hypothetical protein
MIQPVSIIGIWITFWKVALSRVDAMADAVPPCLGTAAAQRAIIHLLTTNNKQASKMEMFQTSPITKISEPNAKNTSSSPTSTLQAAKILVLLFRN